MEPKILKTKSILSKIFLNCILPLLVGLLIYIFLRTGTYINNFFGSVDVNNREISDSIFMYIFRYNLPDFLWAYSLTSALLYLNQKRVSTTYLLLIVLFIAATEVLQLVFRDNFTFDWFDLLAAILGSLLSYFLNQSKDEKKAI